MRKVLAFGIPALDEPVVHSGACPLCHTPHPTMSDESLEAGASWECTRCGQRWSAARLATAAAYARYSA